VKETGLRNSAHGADKFGFKDLDAIHWNLEAPQLYEHSLAGREATIVRGGPICAETGVHTGRSPKDKFTVKDEITAPTVHWNDFNIALDEKYFHIIRKKITDYLSNKPELWIRDCYACADERYRMNIRIVNEKPWVNLFAYNMFLRPDEETAKVAMIRPLGIVRSGNGCARCLLAHLLLAFPAQDFHQNLEVYS
jgi:phosphoenolpyruvate carboxykinase (ATP)